MMASSPTLKQESVVEIGERQVTVVSEVLLEPEVLVVTRVIAGARILKKMHEALPTEAVNDFRRRGAQALTSSLHAHHLRFLRELLSTRSEPETPVEAPIRAGMLASLVLGPDGNVLVRAGEEQVPGEWLRAAYLVVGLADDLGPALDAGSLLTARAASSTLCIELSRSEGRTRVSVVDASVSSGACGTAAVKTPGDIA